jgi:hypothetical protein
LPKPFPFQIVVERFTQHAVMGYPFVMPKLDNFVLLAYSMKHMWKNGEVGDE